MGFLNKKPANNGNGYDPSRLFDVHEHGMTLNMDQFMKKPGVKEDIDALIDIGRAIREKQKLAAQKNQGDGG
ncbi:MAG: hypothetical protein OXU94_10550 [Gammaproteobacteria bacterium]|nr:hypothetical protein [Gammaproteobacteria bacterium]